MAQVRAEELVTPVGDDKQRVQDFWDEASCGEVYADEGDEFTSQADARYALEPYLKPFAGFADGRGRDVLEIGVGMGADHLEWSRAEPRRLVGMDLTPRAVAWTTGRFAADGRRPEVFVGDAENLPFPDESFDLVYSWGVLHHSPDTARCFREVHRVLRPGGEARVMIYHHHSLVGYMLWLRYALARGRFRTPLRQIYAEHLESPGTKAYTVSEAEDLCAPFARTDVRVQLTFGDLLEGQVGQQHRGRALTVARRVWPRGLLRRFASGRGLYLLIRARR